jgi:hypothetical protein
MGLPAQTARRRGPVIRQVDRILIHSENPKPLYDFFTETLKIPTAWLLSENRGSITAGVGIGNVTLEIFRYAGKAAVSRRRLPAAEYSGIAFEPYPTSKSIPELQVRKIPYDTPQPYISTLPKGTQGILWTTIALPSFSKPGMTIFLQENSPAFLNAEVTRKQLGNRLMLNGGGPLGLLSAGEITIGSADAEKDKLEWTRLLGEQSSPGIWRVGNGPSIRLIQDSQHRILRVTLKVKSLNQAKSFLRKSQWLGPGSSQSIALGRAKIQGLDMRLTE